MRVTLAILAVIAALILGRFIWDDVISGEDIPRGVRVDDIAIGNTDRATATERLSVLTNDREVALTWAGETHTDTLGSWGVVLDTEATVDAATKARGGGPVRLLRWMASVVRDRTVEPVWRVDDEILAAAFGPESFDLAVVASPIELDDSGTFVAVDQPAVPVVDLDALAVALLDAANNDGITTLAVPAGGFQEFENADELAADANELTGSPLRVVLAGQLEEKTISSAVLREWLVADGAASIDAVSFDLDRVIATMRELYPDSGAASEHGVQFVIGFDGEVYVVGALDGTTCCADDTDDRLLTAVRSGADEAVMVFPDEPPDAEGLAWAESLGIEELAGEFTTNYTANQTRNINIERISELTRGAVIEPGATFSINDYVGQRTTDKGFVPAGVIADGVFASSVGGGISQYATTLFNAAFFAGLDFGQYQSHSIYISRYPYGREATVSFPAPDLQIVNTTPHGVLLWPTTTADSITVRLYSTKSVWGEQTGQTERTEGTSCTRVTTERTRTFVADGHTEVDTVTARYRPEGVNCDGTPTRAATPTTTSTPTTVP